MKSSISFLWLCLCGWSSQAMGVETVKWRVSIDISAIGERTGTSSGECLISQNLSWEDRQSLWMCQFPGAAGETILMTAADTVGYNYNTHRAYTEHWIDSSTALGQFLFSGFALSDVSEWNSLVVTYDDDQPQLDPTPLYFKVGEKVYSMTWQNSRYVAD